MGNPRDYRKYYTIPEAAEELRVTPQAIYKWMRQGKLDFVYVGSERRITGATIQAFVEASTAAGRKSDLDDDPESGVQLSDSQTLSAAVA